MAVGVNKVILVGNVGTKPELRYTSNNNAVSELRIATTMRTKDREGNWGEKTEWHSVVVWGRTAENCANYLDKGRQVYIEGRLQTRDWVDQNGQKRYKTEVVAQTVQFLGGRGDSAGGWSSGGGGSGGSTGGGGGSGGGGRPNSGPRGFDAGGGSAPADTGFDDIEGDIPF